MRSAGAREAQSPEKRRASEDAELRRTAPGGATALEKRSHLEELQAEPQRLKSAVTSRSSRRSHSAWERSRLEKAREDAGEKSRKNPRATQAQRVPQT